MPTASQVGARDRRLAVLGWFLAALALGLMATVPALVSGGVNDRPNVRHGYPLLPDYVGHLIIVAALSLAGAWLAQHRPRNAIGWILLASGLLQALQTTTDAYGIRALTDPAGSWPLARTTEWFAQWTWIPALLIVVGVLPILYPTGRPPSRFWHRHLIVTTIGISCLVCAAAVASAHFDDSVRGANAGYEPPPWLVVPLAALGSLVTAGAIAVTLVGTVIRTVRARAPERQQLALLVAVVAVMIPTAFIPSQLLFGFAYAMVPVAIVVGVLRYRLLGIEIAVRRTLLYAPLTVLIAVVVGLTTASLARLLPPGPGPLLLASGVVAVLIFPVATRLRRQVDRFVLGDRADPLRQVAGVGAGVSEPSGDPVSSMLAAVTAATGATYGTVVGPDGRALAAQGEPTASQHQASLVVNGETLGTLVVGTRRGQRRVEDADARLVDALAPHLAMVVRGENLRAALAEQQRRTTQATLAERDRLRRDLHDGLGPSLSGISLGLEAAAAALERDPATADVILSRTRTEADAAAREIRRVLDALRPSVLDQHGLAAAVHQTAAGLGLGGPGAPTFTLHTPELEGLPPLVEEAAFRIIAESLTNVVRHARARHCTVLLTCAPHALRLGVEDDGTWTAPTGRGTGTGHGTHGHGLDSMRRRATDLGGWLTVRPAAPHGTVVDALLPWAIP